MLIGILITLLILSLLVLIHEFGHFMTAKKLGIKVEEFGFGFPPRAWGKVIGETLFSINWIPIGGFVKLYGEDEAGAGRVKLIDNSEKIKTEDIDRAFFARPVWQRAVVVVAGVVMNALLAFIIYYVFLSMSGFKAELPLLNDHKFFAVQQENVLSGVIVANVQPNSPAEKAGFKKCSESYCINILTINGIKPKSSEEFVSVIQKNKGKKVTFTVEELTKKTKSSVSLIPRVTYGPKEGAVGINFSMLETVMLRYQTSAQKLLSGIIHPVNLMLYNFDVMRTLIVTAVKEKNPGPLSQGVSGPLGIVRVGGSINEIAQMKERVLQFLNLAGLLSISLAFFNILPIPALDGGRLFFILLEGVTRKKVSPKIEGYIHTVGMVILLGLVVLVTFKDLLQFFK